METISIEKIKRMRVSLFVEGTRIKHFENKKREKNVKMLYRVPRPNRNLLIVRKFHNVPGTLFRMGLLIYKN